MARTVLYLRTSNLALVASPDRAAAGVCAYMVVLHRGLSFETWGSGRSLNTHSSQLVPKNTTLAHSGGILVEGGSMAFDVVFEFVGKAQIFIYFSWRCDTPISWLFARLNMIMIGKQWSDWTPRYVNPYGGARATRCV